MDGTKTRTRIAKHILQNRSCIDFTQIVHIQMEEILKAGHINIIIQVRSPRIAQSVPTTQIRNRCNSWNPDKGFENDSIWPGAHWQKINNGRFCNRKAFRSVQGNFIFHWNSLKNHLGGKHWRIYTANVLNPVAPHLCTAVKGRVEHSNH